MVEDDESRLETLVGWNWKPKVDQHVELCYFRLFPRERSEIKWKQAAQLVPSEGIKAFISFHGFRFNQFFC